MSKILNRFRESDCQVKCERFTFWETNGRVHWLKGIHAGTDKREAFNVQRLQNWFFCTRSSSTLTWSDIKVLFRCEFRTNLCHEQIIDTNIYFNILFIVFSPKFYSQISIIIYPFFLFVYKTTYVLVIMAIWHVRIIIFFC